MSLAAMNRSDILNLYRFNEWANDRLIAAIGALPPEVVNRDLGGGFRSMRGVVAHIIFVEWVWLERWRGVSPSTVPNWVTSEDLTDLIAQVSDIQSRRGVFLDQLTESTLSEKLSFHYVSGDQGSSEFGDLLLHVVNHSTYHRGQLAFMLRQVGTVPPSTDYDVFKAAPG
jgi:uncharacterized damage-inducible protein DinB